MWLVQQLWVWDFLSGKNVALKSRNKAKWSNMLQNISPTLQKMTDKDWNDFGFQGHPNVRRPDVITGMHGGGGIMIGLVLQPRDLGTMDELISPKPVIYVL